MKCYVKSHVVPALTGRVQFLIWRVFEQSAFANIHLLCYWSIIHSSISKFCPKFHVLSSHFFEVDDLLDEHWAKLCTVKIFQLQSMLNVIRCINQRSAFKNSGILCLALILNLKYPSMTVLYAKKSVAGGEIQRVIYLFFQSTNGLVVKVGHRESGDMGSIPDEFWIALAASWPFCVLTLAEPHFL